MSDSPKPPAVMAHSVSEIEKYAAWVLGMTDVSSLADCCSALTRHGGFNLEVQLLQGCLEASCVSIAAT